MGVSAVVLFLIDGKTKWVMFEKNDRRVVAYGKVSDGTADPGKQIYDLRNFFRVGKRFEFFAQKVDPSDFRLELNGRHVSIFQGSDFYPWPCDELADDAYPELRKIKLPELPDENALGFWDWMTIIILFGSVLGPLALFVFVRAKGRGSKLRLEKTREFDEAARVDSSFKALANFMRSRAVHAAKAIKSGRFDPGHIRDLADAAVCGHHEAANLLAYITLFGRKSADTREFDEKRRQVEGLSWLMFASFLKNGNDQNFMADLKTVQSKLDPQVAAESLERFNKLKQKSASIRAGKRQREQV